MKTRINTIKLENFKGATTTLELDGHGAHITGWHGTGKSRFLDAIVWVTTGSDLKGRSNPDDIKDNTGAVGLRPVRATLAIDNGTTVRLFTRGVDEKTINVNGETILNGHEGYYAVDDTKVTAKVFNEQLAEHIGDVATWLKLANIDAITSLAPEHMRNEIISIIGDVTTADVLAKHPDLKPAADLIAKHGLNATRKGIESQRAALPEQIADIKTRINEAEKALERHEPVDTAALETTVASTEENLQAAQDALAQAKQGDTSGLQAELTKIEGLIQLARNEQQKERNARWELASAEAQQALDTAITAYNDVSAKLNTARNELQEAEQAAYAASAVQPTAPIIKQEISTKEANHQALREEWAAAKNAPATVETLALTLREEQVANAAEAFAEAVVNAYDLTEAVSAELEQLRRVIDTARYGDTHEHALAKAEALKAEKVANIEHELKTSADAIETLKNKLEMANKHDMQQANIVFEANTRVEELKNTVATLTEEATKANAATNAARTALGNILIEPEDANEWAHLTAEANELRKQLANPGDQAVITAAESKLTEARVAHKAALESVTEARAANREHAAITNRINELRDNLADVEATRNALTKQLNLIQAFARARIAILTEKAANTFEYVSVELERLTFQGTLEEVCIIRDPAGIRYTATNPGNQALMALDIIKAARKQKGVHPPLLVDALESRRTIDPALEGEQVIATEATGTRKAPTALKIAIVK